MSNTIDAPTEAPVQEPLPLPEEEPEPQLVGAKQPISRNVLLTAGRADAAFLHDHSAHAGLTPAIILVMSPWDVIVRFGL